MHVHANTHEESYCVSRVLPHGAVLAEISLDLNKGVGHLVSNPHPDFRVGRKGRWNRGGSGRIQLAADGGQPTLHSGSMCSDRGVARGATHEVSIDLGRGTRMRRGGELIIFIS